MLYLMYCFDWLMLINNDIYLVIVTMFSLLLLYEIDISPWKFWLDNKSKTIVDIVWVESNREWIKTFVRLCMYSSTEYDYRLMRFLMVMQHRLEILKDLGWVYMKGNWFKLQVPMVSPITFHFHFVRKWDSVLREGVLAGLHCLSNWAITVHWIFCKQIWLPRLVRLP